MPQFPFRTFLFDLDGTLVDHFTAIHRSHVRTLTQFGLPAPTMAQVHRAVGRGLEHAIEALAGRENAHLIPRMLPFYRAYWDQTMLDDVVLLPGAMELLTELKQRGFQSAVYTNKHGPSARKVCAHLKIDALLDGIYGAIDTPWLKPDRPFTEYVFSQLRADPKDTLLIGDSQYDIETAHAAGLPCWCVTTGTHTAAELNAAGADAVLGSLGEVAAALGL
ncbi:MAG: HAD family hydrolase [Opitutaceae bacterium]|nr:HAD family hydrolase [Opitutaceae bacterium]